MIQLKLALKYLLRKPVTLFAVISVLLGTTAFVVVIGVMDGYVTAFSERSRTVLSDLVVRSIDGGPIPRPGIVADYLKDNVPEVEACSPVVIGLGVVKIRGGELPFSLKWCRFVGADAELEHRVTGLDALAAVRPGDDNWIIPGSGLLGDRPADARTRVELVTSSRSGTGPPLRVELRIASVVDFGLHQYDKEFAYVPRALALKFVGLEGADAATWIRVRIRNPRDITRVQLKVQAALERLTGSDILRVRRYDQMSQMFRALKLQRSLSMLILGCLFVAAGFAVVAICYMIVLQKTRDIGVLRTIGLSRGGVLATFVAYGVVVSLLGVTLGMTLGVFILDRIETVRQTLTDAFGHDPFPTELYGFERVPTEVNAGTLVLIASIALGVGFFGSLLPAWRAARLNVVESLRYE